MSHIIRTLVIQTNIPVEPNFINDVEDSNLIGIKKAVSAWLKREKKYAKHTWFHNHEDASDPDYQLQLYPYIQYRVYNEQLRFFALNEGVEVLQEVINSNLLRGFVFKGVKFAILPEYVQAKPRDYNLKFKDDKRIRYQVNDFIALNDDMLKKWKLPENNAVDRMKILHEQLIKSLAMFCKTCGSYMDKDKLELELFWVWQTRWVKLMGDRRPTEDKDKSRIVAVMAFTIEFDCNLDMPEGIALGRAARIGYGWLGRKNQKKILKAL